MKRVTQDALGRRAELAARWMLRLKGYRIRAARERTHLGEIDLIASRGRTLAFVEVKHRAREADAAAAVSQRQQRRIFSAASAYLARHPQFAAMGQRFDVVIVAPGRWPRHILNAWGASDHNGK